MKRIIIITVIISAIILSSSAVLGNVAFISDNTVVNAYPKVSVENDVSHPFDFTSVVKSTDLLFTSYGNNTQYLVPLGMPFGIKYYTEGVLAVGLTDVVTDNGKVNPSYNAGIRLGDIIISVNGIEILSNEMLSSIVSLSDGKTLNVKYKRSGAIYFTEIIPAFSKKDNGYKIGLWVRDSTAGIGTVTFVDPKTGVFGGLGHGICDSDTLSLMPLGKATVYKAEIENVIAGKKGNPGELVGRFASVTSWGEILSNSSNGVFGKLNGDFSCYKSYRVASYGEIQKGDASIITTVSGSAPKEYSVRIESISSADNTEKNFVIRVTDNELLSKTNGIVQGMSGSPIIQNGKIIGAVTHVFINDSQKGYGIYIGNMLRTAHFIDISNTAA